MLRRLLSSDLMQGFAAYFGSSMLNRALPFLLLPVLTTYLGAEQYGIMSLYQAILAIALPVIGMNMSVNVTRIFFSQTKEEVAQTISAILAILAFSVTALTIVASLIVLSRGGIGGISPFWLVVLPVTVGISSVNELGLTVLRNQQRAWYFGFLEILKTVLELGITLLLVIQLHQGWEGRVAGIAISALVVGSLSAIRLARTGLVSRVLTWKRVRGVLSISLPFVPHALGSALISMSDRFFIDHLLDTSAVGVYAAGAQLGMMMSVIVTSFNRSWSPWFFKMLNKGTPASRTRIVKATYICFVVYTLIALAITVFAIWLLPRMTTEPFHPAVSVIPWITFGYALQGMYMTLFGYIVHVARTDRLAILTVTVAAVTIVANYALINMNGIVGAAQATLIAYALMFLGTWWLSQRFYPMPWALWK